MKKKQPEWRPRIKEGQVSIRREGKFFVVVCRTTDESDLVEKSIIRALVKARK